MTYTRFLHIGYINVFKNEETQNESNIYTEGIYSIIIHLWG